MESIIDKMLLIRRVEEEIISRHQKQLMRCPLHLSLGQEAIAVGTCHHLRKEDSVFSTHRSHAHYLAKGGSLDKMILEIHGKLGGCQDGRGGSMHLNDKSVNVMSIPIVASAIPLAVGTALANKMNDNDNIVVCFFGDAAVEEGVFHESMNFASLMHLPIIFVCENNQYSVDTPLFLRQPMRDWKNIAASYGMEMNFAYRNTQNVFEIANLMEYTILCCRSNQPCFLVFDTQRSHVHCGVDKEFELNNDSVNDALTIFYQHYASWTIEQMRERFDRPINEKIKSAFDAAESAPLPTPDMASKYVYA